MCKSLLAIRLRFKLARREREIRPNGRKMKDSRINRVKLIWTEQRQMCREIRAGVAAESLKRIDLRGRRSYFPSNPFAREFFSLADRDSKLLEEEGRACFRGAGITRRVCNNEAEESPP